MKSRQCPRTKIVFWWEGSGATISLGCDKKGTPVSMRSNVVYLKGMGREGSGPQNDRKKPMGVKPVVSERTKRGPRVGMLQKKSGRGSKLPSRWVFGQEKNPSVVSDDALTSVRHRSSTNKADPVISRSSAGEQYYQKSHITECQTKKSLGGEKSRRRKRETGVPPPPPPVIGSEGKKKRKGKSSGLK